MRVKLEIGLLHEEEREKAQEEKKETSCLSPVSRRSLTTLMLPRWGSESHGIYFLGNRETREQTEETPKSQAQKTKLATFFWDVQRGMINRSWHAPQSCNKKQTAAQVIVVQYIFWRWMKGKINSELVNNSMELERNSLSYPKKEERLSSMTSPDTK